MEYYNIIDDLYLNALKESIIKPKIKVELLDYNENVLDEIIQDMSIEDAGSISVNYQQGIRRSCSITLNNTFKNYTPNDNGYIWCNTKFKIYTGIEIRNSNASNYPNYTDTYWFSQGIYILTDPSVLRSMSKGVVTLNGVDKFGIFGSETNFHELEGTYLIPANTHLKNIVTDILNLDMGNGNILDPKYPIIDKNIGEMVLPYDIKKSPESFFSEILIELGNIFGCDIFYDNNGYLNITRGNQSLDIQDKASIWDYKDNLPEYSEVNLTYDFTNIYNTVKVIGNNPASSIYVTTIRNEDPKSPTRVSLIGQKTKYIESTFCYNEDRTKDFAQYLLRKYSIVQNTLTFNSNFIPHLDVNKIISLTDKYYDYDEQKFIIQALTIPLTTNGEISVEATNVANIPYYEY